MHELSIAQNLLQITLKHAQAARAKKVTELHLVIGQMSSVVDNSMQFCWELVAQGTIAEGSLLRFERVPAIFCCTACGSQFELNGVFVCPQCRSDQVRLISGDEFRLDRIEIEPSGQEGNNDDDSCS